MTPESAFSKILRLKRIEAGLSQEQLALAAGVDRTFVSLLEREQRQPSLKTIFALCNALSLDPATIVSEIQEACRENR